MNQLLLKLNKLMLDKEKLLTELLDISQQQNKLLSQPLKEWDTLNELFEKKEIMLKKLKNLDDNLNQLIQQLKGQQNKSNSVVYRSISNQVVDTFHKLEKMVERIKVIEEMNKNLLQTSVASEKRKINHGKMSNNAYNNNNDYFGNESIFFDSKN